MNHLYERAIHILNHVGEIALLLITRETNSTTNDNKLQDYHYFSSILRSTYLKIVEEKASQFKSLCLSEFYETKTLIWHLRK